MDMKNAPILEEKLKEEGFHSKEIESLVKNPSLYKIFVETKLQSIISGLKIWKGVEISLEVLQEWKTDDSKTLSGKKNRKHGMKYKITRSRKFVFDVTDLEE